MLIKKIDHGHRGIAETVAAVIALAHDPETTREMRETALRIVREANAQTEYDKAKAIHDWVKSRIAYERDPLFREFVQYPIYLVRQAKRRSFKAAGDCDDHTAVNMALLSSIGIPTRAVISEDPTAPGNSRIPHWAHIYAEAEVRKTRTGPRQWIPIDSSMWFLKFGKKTGGRQTVVYPHDIPVDLIFDARAKGGQGLGFVSHIISNATNYVDRAMIKRISSPKVSFSLTTNGLGLGLGALKPNGLGFSAVAAITGVATNIVGAATGITQALIGKRLQEKLSKRQQQSEQAALQIKAELQKQAQLLDFQSRELDKQRAAIIAAEEASFGRLVESSKKDRITALALLGLPVAALLVYGYVTSRGE